MSLQDMDKDPFSWQIQIHRTGVEPCIPGITGIVLQTFNQQLGHK